MIHPATDPLPGFGEVQGATGVGVPSHRAAHRHEPVTEQGATSRKVYLPAGCDWYNYWTNDRIKGGQTIVAAAPIDTLPLFVRAGSIVPLGASVLSAGQAQAIASFTTNPQVSLCVGKTSASARA